MATTKEDSDNAESTAYDQIPPQQREKARERDNHSCQLCPRKGPESGGITPLHVHHKSYNPDSCDIHDLDNLLTLCEHCHGWHHNRPTPETPPVEITQDAELKLIPVDFEILDILSQNGPLTTETIADSISSDKTLPAVEERLWRIMGIDTVVSDQSQLLDQYADTRKWGLPYQIETSQRQIPDQVPEIIRRTVDSIVASAIARGCDRDTVAEVINVHPRTTYRIQYRGQAYNFEIAPHIGQGRPRKDGYENNQVSTVDTDTELEGQKHLNEIKDSDEAGGDDEAAIEMATTDSVTVTDTRASNLNGTEDTAVSDDIGENETIDPMQPQIDGSNREWLITASEYPEELHPTIERLNLATIQYREQGHLPDSFGNEA